MRALQQEGLRATEDLRQTRGRGSVGGLGREAWRGLGRWDQITGHVDRGRIEEGRDQLREGGVRRSCSRFPLPLCAPAPTLRAKAESWVLGQRGGKQEWGGAAIG